MKFKLFKVVLPVMALMVTGCNSKLSPAKSLDFPSVQEFVSSHYEPQALDAVPMDYSLKLNSCNYSFDVVHLDTDGFMNKYRLGLGLNGVSVSVHDKFAFVFSSRVLHTIQSIYSEFSSITMEKITEIPLDLTYTVQGDALTVNIETGSAANQILNLFRSLLSVVSLAGVVPSSLLKDSDGFLQYVYFISLALQFVSIGIDPQSTSENDEFHASLSTDEFGYINNANFVARSDLHLILNIAAKQVDPNNLDDVAKEYYPMIQPILYLLEGRFEFIGGFDFGIELDGTFSK